MGEQIASGAFDPIVTSFGAATGAKISQNDDGGPPPITGIPYDSFLMQSIAAGNYTATVTQYGSFAIGPLLTDGFYGK